MLEVELTANQLVSALLSLSAVEQVCILDSCGVGHLGSHLLIAGISPILATEITRDDPAEALALMSSAVSHYDAVTFFTLSYEFGRRLQNIATCDPNSSYRTEPDVYIAQFDVTVFHDYAVGRTWVAGDRRKLEATRDLLLNAVREHPPTSTEITKATSNFSYDEYISAIRYIQEEIRRGNTYQANLTQQLRVDLPSLSTPQTVFQRLREDHPAPFAAFIKRQDSVVVSASPERFFTIDPRTRTISTSPIKGTIARGGDHESDELLKSKLLDSRKDRAENTMIVDLLRNDLGRVCEFGSVRVEKLCDLEEHPTLFHLVSTVTGKLRENVGFSQILKALFPCGSITGAPKISTMKMIDAIEPSPRGLSMGAIGYHIPDGNMFGMAGIFDLSVAIRTMVIRDCVATFNVGGGIVIDSDPQSEYDETLTKAKALLDALGASF